MAYSSIVWKKLELPIPGQWRIIPKLKSGYQTHNSGSLKLFLENEYFTWYESIKLNVDVSHFAWKPHLTWISWNTFRHKASHIKM
jgi:hypothetical protein